MVRVTVVNKGSHTSENGLHTKLNGSLMWYFVVLDSVQLILFSSEETLMAVTRLPDDIYGNPVTELIDVPTRSTRSQQPVVPDSLTSQEGVQPINPPPETSYVGSSFVDHSCLALGLENRGQLRRVEDYLADHNQTLLPVRKRVAFVVFWVAEMVLGSFRRHLGRWHSIHARMISLRISPYLM